MRSTAFELVVDEMRLASPVRAGWVRPGKIADDFFLLISALRKTARVVNVEDERLDGEDEILIGISTGILMNEGQRKIMRGGR